MVEFWLKASQLFTSAEMGCMYHVFSALPLNGTAATQRTEIYSVPPTRPANGSRGRPVIVGGNLVSGGGIFDRVRQSVGHANDHLPTLSDGRAYVTASHRRDRDATRRCDYSFIIDRRTRLAGIVDVVQGRRTLCGFHTYVGEVDVGFVPGRRGVRSEPALYAGLKHAIKLKTSPARLAQLLQPSLAFCFSVPSSPGRYAVIGCKLKQNANEDCNSCASLAGLRSTGHHCTPSAHHRR